MTGVLHIVKFRTFLAYRIESNRIEHGFAESELFQYFDIFMNRTELCFNVFGAFEHRNIEKIRFGSIFQESSRVLLYC